MDWEDNVYWLRRALGFDAVERSEDTVSELPILAEGEDFPDDPTTDTVPKPKCTDTDIE